MKAVFRNCIFLPLCAISIMLFVFSCDDEDEPEIQYPETGFYGDNILMKGRTEYTDQRNSLQAKVPEGKKLKIIITVGNRSICPELVLWEAAQATIGRFQNLIPRDLYSGLSIDRWWTYL